MNMPMKKIEMLLALNFMIWLWVFLTTTLIWVHGQPSCGQESEKAALVEFYNYSGFDLQPLWSSDIRNRTSCPCAWWGVTCNKRGFIVQLLLYYPSFLFDYISFQLNLSLASVPWPVSLAKLHFLQELELVEFYHNSPLPQEIGLLSQSLTSLSLPQCKLLPPLPVAALTNLSKLAHLDLSFQAGNEYPHALFFLGSSIPQKLCNITTLEYLDLSGNGFAVIPSSFGLLPYLSHLDLSHNNLEGPSVLQQIWATSSNLTHLDLSFNFLAGVLIDYPGISNAVKMSFLNLESNNLTGNIPESIGELSALTFLVLRFNNLSGTVPASFGNLTKLGRLDLSNNILSGSIPHQLGNLGNLAGDAFLGPRALDLSFNQLSGKIPASLGGIGANTSDAGSAIDLSYNNLTGDLPWQLLTGSAIGTLDLQFNHLTGFAVVDISSSALAGAVVNTSSLLDLDASANELTGPIPPWIISHLSGLLSLDLSQNQLEATNLPGSSFALLDLNLSSNNLKGPIPTWLSNQSALYSLDLSSNQLEGTIPGWLSNHSALWSLDLSFNKLEGTIPGWRWSCKSGGTFKCLQFLRLSSNNFSGAIPIASLCYAGSQLAVLKLDSNSLGGSITDEIGQCSDLKSLVLKNNLLKGFLPPALGNLSRNLRVLDLSHNNFQGEIAPWIQHMQSLRVLILSHNGFSGHLPTTTWNTTQLQVLDLASNKLKGRIPSNSLSSLLLQGFLYNSIVKSRLSKDTLYDESISIEAKHQVLHYAYLLSATVSLDLSNNALSGPIPPELGLLDGLIFLNLSHNHLRGPIPESLGKLHQLNSLDLSNNELEGEIPKQALCLLTFLSSADVSDNKLSGPIPQCNQWATFTGQSFLGNKGLCGPQAEQACMSPASKGRSAALMNDDEEEDNHDFLLAILVGLCIAFPPFLGLSILWNPLSYRIIKASTWVLSKVDALEAPSSL